MIDWNPIILGGIAIVVPIWAAWMTYRTEALKKAADVIKKTAAETHEAVNSERTAMQLEVKRLNESNAALGLHNAALTVNVSRLEGIIKEAEK